MQEAGQLIRPERIRLERRLLELERRTGGGPSPMSAAASTVPRELHAARGAALPPSRQGASFARSLRIRYRPYDRGLFGIRLLWDTEGRLPAYLTLVCALFHNGRTPVWEP